MPRKTRKNDIVSEAKARQEEVCRIERNEAIIDEGLAYLARYIGRELMDQEQCDILDIVDEFTPKDEEGNYVGDLFPVESTWKVYLMRRVLSRIELKERTSKVVPN